MPSLSFINHSVLNVENLFKTYITRKQLKILILIESLHISENNNNEIFHCVLLNFMCCW